MLGGGLPGMYKPQLRFVPRISPYNQIRDRALSLPPLDARTAGRLGRVHAELGMTSIDRPA